MIELEEAQLLIPGAYTDATHAQAALDAFMRQVPTPVHEFKPDPIPLAADAVTTLPEFQQWGVHFIRKHYREGLIVADDMGLGKTVQTIIALKDEPGLKFVMCPAFLRKQWAEEIKRWSGQDSYVWMAKGERKTEYKGQPWIIAFYRAAEEAHRACVGYEEYIAIVDEAHNLRGNNSQGNNIVQGVCNFASGRVLLTGSLLINDGSKMWPVLNLAQPQTFGTFYDFTARHCGGKKGIHGWEIAQPKDGKPTLFNTEELKARLTYMSYRRTREDVPSDQLPFETVYSTVWIDVPDSIGVDGLAALHLNATAWGGYLARLNLAKNPVIAEQIISDMHAGITSITFCYTKEQVAALHALVPGSLAVTGTGGEHAKHGVEASQRLPVVNEYVARCRKESRTPALICTIDSLSEGANLQWAKAVNIATLDWTPERLRQCVARAARMGNTGKIAVRIFAARRSADEPMLKLMTQKLRDSQKVIGSGRESEKGKMIDAMSPNANHANILREMYLRLKGKK